MPKLLYLTANTKSEAESTSKTVGRALVNALLRHNPGLEVDELDLYDTHLPKPKGEYFEGRSALLCAEKRESLPKKAQEELTAMETLCEQFKAADIIILACPMWNVSFPAPVKAYFDCVIQVGKTISFDGGMPHGLLHDKQRSFVYVQSSGAKVPLLLRPTLNRGLNYIKDMVHLMGVSDFEELLADGTGDTEAERQAAVHAAIQKADALAKKLSKG